jgi:hypothetical protein
MVFFSSQHPRRALRLQPKRIHVRFSPITQELLRPCVLKVSGSSRLNEMSVDLLLLATRYLDIFKKELYIMMKDNGDTESIILKFAASVFSYNWYSF